MRPILGFIGAGKVGGALARLSYDAGYQVAAVACRTHAHAKQLASQVGAVVTDDRDVVHAAELILLTVPDDAIESTALSLADVPVAGKGIVHTSGARNASALSALAARGAMVGSMHPAYPFTDRNAAARWTDGVTFAVEAEDTQLAAWLLELVGALRGTPLRLAAGQKMLYHAALAIASNYTVTLYAIAESLLVGIGAEREAADSALNTLVGAAVENIRRQGIPAALPGALTRSDVGTIAAHLATLSRVDERIATLYRQLAELSFPMLAARGVDTAPIAALLAEAPQE